MITFLIRLNVENPAGDPCQLAPSLTTSDGEPNQCCHLLLLLLMLPLWIGQLYKNVVLQNVLCDNYYQLCIKTVHLTNVLSH